MTKGVIFDIKHYAVHDGPGIRTTVFFKGCPLRCQWCHNPEGISLRPELLVSQSRCVESCKICISECPLGIIAKNEGRIAINLKKCDLCGRCVEACSYEALGVAGKEVTVCDLLENIEKDRIFYDESDGGVTISGGEPFGQWAFLMEVLSELKKRDIHVALDTSGYAPVDELVKASYLVDMFLYDLKVIDSTKHEEHTGVPNDLILDNLLKLSEQGMPVEVRIPLIAGINDDVNNIRETIKFLLSLKTKPKVSFLPYHRGGCEKYNRLGKRKPTKAFESPSEHHIAKITTFFTDQGFSVKRGG